VCNIVLQLGVVIHLATTHKGYYHDRLCGTIAHELFHNINKSPSEASTPTCGGDAFCMKLDESRRFGSSGWNLTFKGLLLGASLRLLMEGTRSDPRQSGFLIHNTLAHAEGVFAMSCRKPKVSRVSKWRLRWTGGTEAHGTAQAEVKSWRGHAGCQSKAVASVQVRHVATPHWTTKSDVSM
jgi:hypothetical protein